MMCYFKTNQQGSRATLIFFNTTLNSTLPFPIHHRETSMKRHQHNYAMPLFSDVDTDPCVKELVTKVVSLLDTPSYLKSITRVHTTTEGVNLFQFRWAEEFQNLEDQLARAMV
jgi:hypothetical protein